MSRWVYLSFANEGPGGFLSACVVHVNDNDPVVREPLDPNERWVAQAIDKARSLGLNPGGGVAAWDITEGIGRVPEADRNRLLNRAEAESLGNPPRAAGFYWVKFDGRWIVVEWPTDESRDYAKGWYICGDAGRWPDSDFEEIGPRIEEPR